MAFDNLQFRSTSFNYNHNGFADDPSFISQATKDIGNDSGSPATNNCLKFELAPLNTVWNDDVTVSAQVEVYFQALVVADSNGNTTADSPSWLSKVPVEQRQGLFRLPRYYSADGSITKTVYRAYKENDGLYYLYIDTNVVKGLHKTTRTDGSVILGYPPAVPEGDKAVEGSPVTDLYFPQPTTSDEFTIKRLTHSITDFVTYQAGGQLTSNILNFQKEQEMYLIQELLWTIEMDMLTFSDLSGLGSIVTAGNDGTIDTDQIRLSLYQLTDTQDAEGSNTHVVLYKDQIGDDWTERQKSNLLAYNDLTDVTINADTLTGGHVVYYDSTAGEWVNGTVSDAANSCTEKSASVLKMCADSVASNRTVGLNGILINNGSNTFDVTSDTTLITASGLAKVPLTTLSNVTAPSPTLNHVLYWNGSAWANTSIGSLTSGILGPAGGDTFFFDLVYNNVNAPASGKIILLQSNGSAATTWASVTEIQVNTTDKDSAAISSWLDSLDDGSSVIAGNIKIFNKAAPEQYGIFNLTSVTGTGSTRSLSVTHVSSNTNPSADMEVYLTMSYKGDQGDRGPAGTAGTNGQNGSQGFQGIGFAEAGATCTLTNSNQDLTFSFPREDPAGTSPDPTPVVCAGITAAVGVEILYIQSFQINPNGYGFYNYVLNTAADGSGTSYNAINAMEEHNDGPSAGSSRVFNGITYTPASGAGDLTRIMGVDTVTNDTVKILPAGNPAPLNLSSTTATHKLQVLCKAQAATKNSFTYARIFSVANAIRTVQCG